MGNKTPRAEEQQLRRQWKKLNSFIVPHNCCQEEINIDELGESAILVFNPEPVCFNERRKKIPLTLMENLEEIRAEKAVKLLEDAKFHFTHSSMNVMRRLEVNRDKRSQFEQQVHLGINNYSNAMEECLDDWIVNNLNANWNTFIQAVSFYEPKTGEKLREFLGLYSTDFDARLKQRCGEEFIFRLASQKLNKPHHFQLLAPYLLSDAGEALIIVHDNSTNDHKVLLGLMLQHWMECWKEKATYEALICVVKDALPSEPEIIKFVESSFTTRPAVPNFYTRNKTEIQTHREAYKKIESKFAEMWIDGAIFLEKTTEINFNEMKFTIVSFYHRPVEAENMHQLFMNFVAPPNINLLHFELFEILINKFGDDERKQRLKAFKIELDKYLDQSILHLPRNFSDSNQLQPDLDDRVYFKIPDTEFETPKLYGSDVKDIQKRLAEHLNLSDQEHIEFVEYRKGCIELIFKLKMDRDHQHPIPNTTWDEEHQEHKITGDILTLLPDSFRKRNKALTYSLETKAKVSSCQDGNKDKRLQRSI